jgi:hypothetical protein
VTLGEAKKTLDGKLEFGNEAQIKAVRFMEKVEACCEAIQNCDDYQEHLWSRFIERCDCMMNFEDDVSDAARKKLKEMIHA